MLYSLVVTIWFECLFIVYEIKTSNAFIETEILKILKC